MPTERTHHGDTVIDEYAWLAAQGRPGDHRLPEGRERLHRGGTAHLAGAAGDPVHRDEDAAPRRPTSRCRPARAATGTTPGRSRGSSTASTAGARSATGETDPPMPADGAPLDGRGDPARRQRARRGARLLRARHLRRQPGRPAGWRTPRTSAGDERFTLRVKDLRHRRGAGRRGAGDVLRHAPGPPTGRRCST